MQLSRPHMKWCNVMIICSLAPNEHVNDMAMQMGKTNLLNQVPVGSKLLGKHNSETEEFLWEILDLQLCNAIVTCPFAPNGLARGPKPFISGISGVHIRWNAYLWNR